MQKLERKTILYAQSYRPHPSSLFRSMNKFMNHDKTILPCPMSGGRKIALTETQHTPTGMPSVNKADTHGYRRAIVLKNFFDSIIFKLG